MAPEMSDIQGPPNFTSPFDGLLVLRLRHRTVVVVQKVPLDGNLVYDDQAPGPVVRRRHCSLADCAR